MPTRASDTGRRDPLITGINITPLVDIVLVLLVVLMVVSTYIVTQTMRVDLPRANTENTPKSDPLTLTILRDGGILLDDQPIVEAEVPDALALAFRSEADRAMVISADRTVPHGRVVEFVDIARQSGATRFAIKVAEDR
jgi:biopolymer transport protein ExbD